MSEPNTPKRLEPEGVRMCDLCFATEVDDVTENNFDLRKMYMLEDGCIICQKCLDAGKHNEGVTK